MVGLDLFKPVEFLDHAPTRALGCGDLNRNFRFSSQQPNTICPFRNSSAQIFSLAEPRARNRVQTMRMRAPNCWSRPSHLVLSDTPPFAVGLDRFPGSHSLGYPAGSDSPAIRRSILPNNRFVRWLSANSSQ